LPTLRAACVGAGRWCWHPVVLLSAALAAAETLPVAYYGRALAGLDLDVAAASLLASFIGTAATYVIVFELCSCRRWLRRASSVAIAFGLVALQVAYFGIYREFSTLPTVSIIDFARQTPQYAWVLFIDRLSFVALLLGGAIVAGLARGIERGSARARQLGPLGFAGLAGTVLASAWAARSPFMSFSQQAAWLVVESGSGPGVVNASWTPDRAKPLPQPAKYPANVIVFRLEEVAARATTLVRPELPTTPLLAKFIEDHPDEAFSGRQHFANSTATDVSVLSIYTGLSPAAPLEAHRHVPILWDYFAAAGYDTSVFMPFHLEWGDFKTRFNARPGELHLNKLVEAGNANLPIVYDNSINDAEVVDQALAYQKHRAWKEPFFQVVSLKMPHAIGEGARVNELHYDAWAGEPEDLHDYYNGIRHDDILIQQFIAAIPAKTREHTVLVFASDHGTRLSPRTDGVEELHRLDNYHQETTHVPFVVVVPEALQQKLPPSYVRNLKANLAARATSNIDIVPTLLGLTGIEKVGPHGDQDYLLVGRDLTREIPRTEGILQLNTGALRRWDREHFAIVLDNGARQYLFSMGRELVYDMVSDPLELTNVAESETGASTIARARALTAQVPELLRIQRKYRSAEGTVKQPPEPSREEEKQQVAAVALRPAQPLVPRPLIPTSNQPASGSAQQERVLVQYEVPLSGREGATRVDLAGKVKNGASDIEWRVRAGDELVYVARVQGAASGGQTGFTFRWKSGNDPALPLTVQLVGVGIEEDFGVDVELAESRIDDAPMTGDFEVVALGAERDTAAAPAAVAYPFDRFQKRECLGTSAGVCPDGFLVWGPYVSAKRHSILSLRFDIDAACADTGVWMDLTAAAGSVPIALSPRHRSPSAGARSFALTAELDADAEGIEGRLNVQTPSGGPGCAVTVRNAVLTVSEPAER
jgi:hypothetical protein